MDKFKLGNIEFEIEKFNGYCSCCYYYFKCSKLENPEYLGDKSRTFKSFCTRHLSMYQRPVSGTLEKNLPHIFTGEIRIEEVKEKQLTEKEAINRYCKSFCVLECQKSECPLYQFKTE